MFPAIVLVEAEIDLYKWPPLGSLRFANKVQPGLLRGAIGLQRITFNAGADDVLPACRPATVAGDDMVQIEILAITGLAAILASVLVALENIVPGEFDLFLGEMIIHQEKNHPRQTQSKRNGPDGFRVGFMQGNVAPFGEIIGLERTVIAV